MAEGNAPIGRTTHLMAARLVWYAPVGSRSKGAIAGLCVLDDVVSARSHNIHVAITGNPRLPHAQRRASPLNP